MRGATRIPGAPQAPVKVLHITFNMGIGGTEQVIRQLVEGVDQSIVTSEILCIDGTVGPIGEALSNNGVPVHCVSRSPGFDRTLVREIRSLVKKRGVDIVHCHQYTPYFYGWLGTLGTGAKTILTEHGRFHPDRHRYKALPFNAVASRMTSELISISESTKEALVEYEFMPRSRVRVIYNGIRPLTYDDDAASELRVSLGIPEGDFVAGTVARLDPVKNQAMMLEAFARFLQRNPNSWLLMVGDGPDRTMLEDRARALEIEASVIFTGFVNEPVNHLALMDVFLLSSHTEGTSMTLLEAMSLGIPSLVTEVGGNPEIIQQWENGILVPSDDPGRFCDALTSLHDDRELRERLQAGAQRAFASRFSARMMVNEYMSVYQRHSRRVQPVSAGKI